MYSAYKLNKQGDNIQPWRTPFPIWNQSVVPGPVLTVPSWPAHKFVKRQVRWPGIPISFRVFPRVYIHSIISEGHGASTALTAVGQRSPFWHLEKLLRSSSVKKHKSVFKMSYLIFSCVSGREWGASRQLSLPFLTTCTVPHGSLVKNPPDDAGDADSILGLGRFPWRRKWQPTPVILPGESYGQSSLAGYSPWGCKTVGHT